VLSSSGSLTSKFKLNWNNWFKFCVPQHGLCLMLYGTRGTDRAEHVIKATVRWEPLGCARNLCQWNWVTLHCKTNLVIHVFVLELQVFEILAFFVVVTVRRTVVKLAFTLSAFELTWVKLCFSSCWTFGDALSAGSIQRHMTEWMDWKLLGMKIS
jgi:hypothetical protein